MGGFFAAEQFVEAERFFRRLAFALGGGNEQHELFACDVFGFVVGGGGVGGVHAGGGEPLLQLCGHFAGVAGLRGGNHGHAQGFGGGSGGCGGRCTDAGLHGLPAGLRPAVAGEPGQLQGGERGDLGGEFGGKRVHGGFLGMVCYGLGLPEN